MKQLICPVSSEKVDEQRTRLNAFFTILLLAAGIYYKSIILLLVLLVDFYIRAFSNTQFSPVGYVSAGVARLMQLRKKPIDKAPKIFAARMGFVMTILITGLFLADYQVASIVVAAILIFFATLEFVLGICVGCYIYTYLVLPAYKKK